MKESPKHGVVVLGMHRSGTSAATRLINTLGLATCDADDFVQGPWNPTGHWESRTLALLDDQLLAEMGRAWWYPPPTGEGYWEVAERIVTKGSQARRIFGRVHPQRPWVWKDPRACLVFPFWREALRGRFVVSLVMRNPLEVATSLNRRHGTPIPFGVALWERYNRLALEHSKGMPVIVSDFEELVKDPVQWVASQRDFLVESGFSAITMSDEVEVRSFVDPGLRHTVDQHRGEPAESGSASSDLYEAVSSAKGASACFVPPALSPELPSVQAELDLFGPDHEPFRVTPSSRSNPAAGSQSVHDPEEGRSETVEPEALESEMPNLFIVGAPCSNTASIATQLAHHSEISVAPGELHYFGKDLIFRNRQGSSWRISREEYLARFTGASHASYRCDRSDFYLYSQSAAEEIAGCSPRARIIAVLRNPVEQIYSQHRRMLFQSEEDLGDLAEALDAEEDRKLGRRIPEGCRAVCGLFYRSLANYPEQLERLLSVFGTDQVHIVLHDDLVSDTASTYSGIFAFLGLDVPRVVPPKVLTVDMEVRSSKVRGLVSDTRAGTRPRLRKLGRLAVRSPHARAALRRRLARTNTRRSSALALDPALRRRLQEELSGQIRQLEDLLERELRRWH